MPSCESRGEEPDARKLLEARNLLLHAGEDPEHVGHLSYMPALDPHILARAVLAFGMRRYGVPPCGGYTHQVVELFLLSTTGKADFEGPPHVIQADGANTAHRLCGDLLHDLHFVLFRA